MPTNPPPCYRCGMRPSMLPIAYCAECYQLTGARLLTAVEVAAELGLERTRIHQLSRQHGIGLPAGPRNTRLYTPAMVETLRTIRRPGGRPVTTNRYTPDMYSVGEVAVMLGTSRRTIQHRAQARGIGQRIGARTLMFTADDVEALRPANPPGWPKGRPRREAP